jgi:hypothetical protein
MANLARFVSPLVDLDTFYIFDDFWSDQTDLTWIDTVVGTTPTASVGDAANGIMALLTTATDNDEVNIESANEVFLIAANRQLSFKARVQFTEANTDDANVGVGFVSAVAAETLVDDGGGMRVTGNLATIHKIDGGTTWRCTSRNGTETTTNTSSTTAGGASYQVLEIVINDFDGVNVSILYKVDGVFLRDTTTGDIIRHTLLIASSTEMAAWAGAKAGGANAETFNVDYILASQTRAGV